MTAPTPVESLLRRDYLVTIGALAVLIVLAWIYVASGAGMGMSAWDMTRLALFPRPPQVAMPGMDMGAPAHAPTPWALIVAMWWVMMIGMMAPSAAPAILLY